MGTQTRNMHSLAEQLGYVSYTCDVGPDSRERTKSSTSSRSIGLCPHPHAPTLLRGHTRQIFLLVTDALRRLLLALRDPDLFEVDVAVGQVLVKVIACQLTSKGLRRVVGTVGRAASGTTGFHWKSRQHGTSKRAGIAY